MLERDNLLEKLLNQFVKDLTLSLKPFTHEEQITFLELILDLLKNLYDKDKEGSSFDADRFLGDKMFRVFREKMTAFVNQGLQYYFMPDDFSKTLLFAKLEIKDSILNEQEQFYFAQRIYLVAKYTTEQLYLKPAASINLNKQDITKLIETDLDTDKQPFKSRSPEYTRSRQVLLYYFILKLIGITKLENSSRKLAQFAHALFAYPIDNIDNSAIYKLLKQAPHLRKEKKSMLSDLEFVKHQFELIGLQQGVNLVEKEINGLKST